MTEWRAALWASALENQGISAGTGGALALGAELQREYDANRMNDFPFMPEVPDAVAHLRKRGLRVVVITNGHHVVQRDKLAACAAHVLFPKPETIIVGGEEVLQVDRRSPTRASSSALATSPVCANQAVRPATPRGRRAGEPCPAIHRAPPLSRRRSVRVLAFAR